MSVAAVPRPRATVIEWVGSTDHKRIGVRVATYAFGFFLVSGVFALFMRAELARRLLRPPADRRLDARAAAARARRRLADPARRGDHVRGLRDRPRVREVRLDGLRAGALFPLIVFGLLYAWPAIERRITGDHARHELLDRPRDAPWRTATIAAFFSWVAIVFLAGSQDQVSVHLHISYVGLIWAFRIASIVVPFVVFFVTRRVCRELKETELHPFRGWTTGVR